MEVPQKDSGTEKNGSQETDNADHPVSPEYERHQERQSGMTGKEIVASGGHLAQKISRIEIGTLGKRR